MLVSQRYIEITSQSLENELNWPGQIDYIGHTETHMKTSIHKDLEEIKLA